MNNPDEQLPFLLTSDTAPASSPANFGPGFSGDHNPGRNFSKLRIGPTLGGIAITQPRLGKKFNPGRGSGGVKVPCSECGKRFGSWKALFGHMRCHPERQWRGMVPPPNLRPISGAPCPPMLPAATPAPYLTMTKEDYEVCECLLMLANGVPTQNLPHMEEIHPGDVELIEDTSGLMGQFECSSCKKVFGSHQALGGHRASHKNVKGCFTLNTELIDCGDQARTPSMTQPATNSSCADTNLDLNLRLGL